MYLIQISLCRDPYSYDALKNEHNNVFESAVEAVSAFERYQRDYQPYVDRREDSVSMVKIELFSKNNDRGWSYEREWDYKLPLKKLVVVNPELAAHRAKNPPEPTARVKTMNVPAGDVWMDIADAQEVMNAAAQVGPLQGGF